MDKIEERLHDTSKNCFDCYEAWAKDKKNKETRGKLQEAIHDLRRVASRVEIELATSERDEMTQTHIPIPSHRDSQRGSRNNKESVGNQAEHEGSPKPKPKRAGPPRGSRKSA